MNNYFVFIQCEVYVRPVNDNNYHVTDEIYRLRELKQNTLLEKAEREGKRQRIAVMTDFLNEQSCELEEYDEQLVTRLIEKVTVCIMTELRSNLSQALV